MDLPFQFSLYLDGCDFADEKDLKICLELSTVQEVNDFVYDQDHDFDQFFNDAQDFKVYATKFIGDLERAKVMAIDLKNKHNVDDDESEIEDLIDSIRHNARIISQEKQDFFSYDNDIDICFHQEFHHDTLDNLRDLLELSAK